MVSQSQQNDLQVGPMGTQNRSKIDKNQDLGSKVSCWVSPVTLDQQTGIKMMTQDPKNGAPRPPKYQDSKLHMHKAWPPYFFLLESLKLGLGFQNASQPITRDRGPAAGGSPLRIMHYPQTHAGTKTLKIKSQTA